MVPSADKPEYSKWAGSFIWAMWCGPCREEMASLLIDRQGCEIDRKLGPVEWDSEEVVAEIRRYL